MYKVEQLSCSNTVFICGELTIYHAEESFNELAKLINQDKALIVDLEGVTNIDCSGVQLLLMANIDRNQRGFSFSLVNHSKTVVQVFERLGLLGLFNDPVLLTGSDELFSVNERGGS